MPSLGRSGPALLLLLVVMVVGIPQAARAPQVTLPAAAAGFTADLDCGTGGAIVVTSALYEPADPTIVCTPLAGKPLPPKTVGPAVAEACDGKPSCVYPVCPYVGFPGGGPGNDGAACAKPAVPPTGDPCPNHPKQFVVEYSCTHTGWMLAAMILVGGGVYVGGGVLHGSKAGGKAVALASHPHYGQWQELRALALDGVAYARGRARGATGGYETVRGAVSSGARHGERPRQYSSNSGKQKGEKRPSSSSEKTSSKGTSKHSTNHRQKTQENDKTAVAPGTARAAPGAALEADSSSAAGGGGRWVHVS